MLGQLETAHRILPERDGFAEPAHGTLRRKLGYSQPFRAMNSGAGTPSARSRSTRWENGPLWRRRAAESSGATHRQACAQGTLIHCTRHRDMIRDRVTYLDGLCGSPAPMLLI